MSSSTQQILDNIQRHERIASAYDQRHEEIYNEVEQQRLRAAIRQALEAAQTDSHQMRAFDLGCGAGNLTRHFLAEQCKVTAADVTPSFVAMVTAFDRQHVDGLILNGEDLSNVPDASYDIAATYSVLHHIPDYLGIVSEMARIIKPGGVVLIDHEWSAGNWQPSPALLEYRSQTEQPRTLQWYTSRLFRLGWWLTRWKQLFNPRYQEEGDIHVWPDDHIEWDAVEHTLVQANCVIIHSEDYLLYEPHVDPSVYEKYRDRCSNMHLCIAQKQ